MSNCYNFYMVNKNNKLCLCCCFCLNNITINCSNWRSLLENIFAFVNGLRSIHFFAFVNGLHSMHCRKLCRPPNWIRTFRLLPHPGHELWLVLHAIDGGVIKRYAHQWQYFSYVGWPAIFHNRIQMAQLESIFEISQYQYCFTAHWKIWLNSLELKDSFEDLRDQSSPFSLSL